MPVPLRAPAPNGVGVYAVGLKIAIEQIRIKSLNSNDKITIGLMNKMHIITDTDVVLRKLVAVTMVRVVDNKLETADCGLDMDYFVDQTFFIRNFFLLTFSFYFYNCVTVIIIWSLISKRIFCELWATEMRTNAKSMIRIYWRHLFTCNCIKWSIYFDIYARINGESNWKCYFIWMTQ